MVDFSGPQLGDVTIEVRAAIDKLAQDFARARGQTKAFEQDTRAAGNALKGAFDDANRLEAEYRALARSYDPLRAAATRYGDALVRINRLQQAGMLSPTLAGRWAGAARREFDRAATGLAVVGAESKKAGQGIGVASSALRGFAGILGVTSATALIRQLQQVAIESIESAAAIKDVSMALGLTTTELQEYRLIAKDLGITQQDIEGAFREFDQTVRQAAAGLERPKKLFELLEISLTDASGAMKSNNELFLETIDRLGQVGNRAERSAGQAVAFGETFGPKMSQAVAVGAAGISELTKSLEGTASILSNEEIQKADDTAKKLKAINDELSADISRAAIKNADSIVQLSQAWADLKRTAVEAGLAVPSAITAITNSIPPLVLEVGKALPILGHFFALLQTIQNTPVRGFNIAAPGGAGVRVPLGKAMTVQERMAAAGLNKLPAEISGKGGLSLAGLLAPKGRTPRARGGGRTVENQFERESIRAREERLRLEREATSDLIRQNEIDKELIDIKHEERIEQLRQMVNRKSLTAKQAEKLKAEDAANAAVEKELADRKLNSELIERSYRLSEEMLQLEQDGLGIELRLARTDEERRKLELLILSSTQQQARNEIEKEIALAEELKDAQRIAELVEQRRKLIENQNAEIAAFDVEHLTGFERFRNQLPRTGAEIRERAEQIRFDNFQRKLDEAAQFADEVGSAFGGLAGDLARGVKPLQAFTNFLSRLADTFTENFIVKPVQEWATRNIGGPAAKRFFGKDLMKEGGLNTEQMNIALALATNNLNMLSQAAALASTNLAATGAGPAGDPLAAATDPISEAFGITVETGLDPFTDAAQASTRALNAQIPVIGQFGGGLMQILSSLSGAGGSGGGGFLGSLLNIAGAAFGASGLGGLGGGSIMNPTSMGFISGIGGMSADAVAGSVLFGGFARGGFTGRGFDDQVRGVVHANEFVFDAPTTRKLRPLFEMISAGRLPSFGPVQRDGGGRGNPISIGAINVHGVRDDRSARRSARQVRAQLQRELSYINRAGFNR